jgi:anaerobic ribonucleoside-triphosphate reductase activating protein
MGDDLLINAARWIDRSRVNGPGERFVLWVQGCGLRCPGCWNRDMWDFQPRHPLTVDQLCGMVLAIDGIEGVTFTGGEPMAQAHPLAEASSRLRAAGLSIMVFTGHEIAELRDDASQHLLDQTDIAVTGRYLRHLRDTSLLWRGSGNQRVSFLSERYSEAEITETAGALEIHLSPDGSAVVTGFPTDELVLSNIC